MSSYTPRKTNILKLLLLFFFLSFTICFTNISTNSVNGIKTFATYMIFLYNLHIYQQYLCFFHISEIPYFATGPASGFFDALGNFKISAVH